MPATKNSGTAHDWITNLTSYLGSSFSVADEGSNSNNDNYYIYLDDPNSPSNSNQYVGIEVDYDSISGYGNEPFIKISAGEGKPDSPSDLSFSSTYWVGEKATFSSSSGFWTSKTTPATWWYSSGSDYFWTVCYANGTDDNNTSYSESMYLGWQKVDTFWEYTENNDISGVATLADGSGSGWESLCTVQSFGASPLQYQSNDTVTLQSASLTAKSEWLQQKPTFVCSDDGAGRRTLLGTVDAWGLDIANSSPQHLTTITCSSEWQYMAPGSDEPKLFFKV